MAFTSVYDWVRSNQPHLSNRLQGRLITGGQLRVSRRLLFSRRHWVIFGDTQVKGQVGRSKYTDGI